MTFLFTDIEGSTRLLHRLGREVYRQLLEDHAAAVRRAVARAGGFEIGSEGDGFFLVFPQAAQAAAAAAAIQRELGGAARPHEVAVRVRMGMHTGEGHRGGDSYVGLDVHRAARISAAAHGGQVLVSAATAALLGSDRAPDGLGLRNLGEHRLKDFVEPEPLFQLVGPGLADRFPPPRTLGSTGRQLPVELTSFVGRARELQEVEALLDAGRLVTLTGPGGTGKSRLAVQVAAEAAERLPGGARLVPLGEVTEPAAVEGAICDALGLPDTTGRPAVDRIADVLGRDEALLVLDNLEQIAGAGSVVADLLAAVPKLRILATSQVPLHLDGEQEYQVPSLELPPSEGRVAPGDVLTAPAGRLFVERARAVRPDFALDAHNAATIAAIVHRLDGLPLAIELAAARAKLLPPEAILARLEGSLDLLARDQAGGLARHRTLRDTIAWSYELLDEPQRRLLRRLAVFSDGAGPEHVEAVCGSRAELGIDVLEGLAALVDHSLVRQTSWRGEPRFELLQTIREFARERLRESGEADDIARRHAVAFLRLAEEAAPHLEGPAQITWLTRLEREHANLRAAMVRTLADTDPARGLRFGVALWRFWFFHRHYREGREFLAAALGRAATDPLRGRAAALIAAAALATFDGDREAGAALAATALEAAPEDSADQVTGTWVLGAAVMDRDPGRAEELFARAGWLARESGHRRGEAWASYWLGILARRRGADEVAAAHYEDALRILRDLQDSLGVGWCLEQFGDLAVRAGEPDRAVALFRESLEVFEEAGDRDAMARALNGLGVVARERGDASAAVDLHERALRLRRQLGIIRPLISTLLPLGLAARAAGDVALAARVLAEAHALARGTGARAADATVLDTLAAVATDRARPAEAARLHAAAEQVREEAGRTPRPTVRATLERERRTGLTEADLARERAAGRTADEIELAAIVADLSRSTPRTRGDDIADDEEMN